MQRQIEGSPIVADFSLAEDLDSRPREQIVDQLTQRLNPSTWHPIGHAALSNVFYKAGNEPGFFAVLSVP